MINGKNSETGRFIVLVSHSVLISEVYKHVHEERRYLSIDCKQVFGHHNSFSDDS